MDRHDRVEYAAIDEIRSWTQGRICASLWGPSDFNEGPVIMAAGLQDSSRLASLLERAQLLDLMTRSDIALDYSPSPDFGWGMELPTPLLRAIERHRPENIRLLLDHDANPNGVLIETQIQLARIHRRFTTRPRSASGLTLQSNHRR
jgi:hypothetical protein